MADFGRIEREALDEMREHKQKAEKGRREGYSKDWVETEERLAAYASSRARAARDCK